MEGKVQVYTGNGKGKATAALGLAIQNPCAGRKMVIDQFVRGMTYSGLKLPDYFENLSLEQFGRGCFVCRKPTDEDYEKATGDLARMKTYPEDEGIDLLIFNEIDVTYEYKLINPKEVMDLPKERPKTMETISAGRYTPQEFTDFTDLVTEMKEVKHYYKKGPRVKLGIEY